MLLSLNLFKIVKKDEKNTKNDSKFFINFFVFGGVCSLR